MTTTNRNQRPFFELFFAVFVVLCAESFIVESRIAESLRILSESDIMVLSMAMPGFFAGLVSAPAPKESERIPALVALSLLARFDEQAAIVTASGTAPNHIFHLIIASS